MTALQHDGSLILSVGASATAKTWNKTAFTWGSLLARLNSPVITYETKDQYDEATSVLKTKAKDVGGFVGGVLQGQTRGKTDVISRQLIALDLDDVEDLNAAWLGFQLLFDCAACIHTTHSHREYRPRARLIIPLAHDLKPKDFTTVSKHIAEQLGLGQFDPTTHEANRLMFWPSVSSDALDEFFFDYVDAPWLDPTVLLKKEKELEQLVEQAKEYPTAIPGMVGSFNTLFPIAKAIEEFIPDIYEQVSAGRFKLAGADSQGGFVIYDGGRWCFSHHAGDPIQGRLTHSFDLVCTHKFGGDAVAMQAWLIEQKLCPDGVAGLVLDKKGNPMATVGNMRSILRGDSRLNSGGKGTIALDAFAGKLMVCGDFPWLGLMDRETLVWTDTDDAGLREFFETEYGMTDRLKLQDALALTAEANKYHPVRSYLNKQVWDGRCRVDTLLVDFLGAEDSPYVRTVTRKALIGALARVMTPGTKHDHVLVLVGPQGCRKSTTISKLGGEWYTDSLYTMNGKEAYELVQGFWIIEVSEMAAARKSDIEQMKQFITKQSDNFRAAYDRRTIDRPRQCAFFGTTNDEEFLKDYTGNRRFWPVKVRKVSEDVFAKLDKEYIGQVWAEVMRAFRAGENWHLDEEAEQSAKVVQDQHLAVSPMAGVVYEFIDTAVPKGWESMPIHKRREWYNLPPQEQEAKYKRTRVCALEIWLECLEGKKTDFNTSKAKEINNIVSRHGGWIPKNMNFGKEYGIQRGWERLTHKHL